MRNLDKYQHYKARRPPWVRLYREILENQEHCALPDSAWRLALEIVLLATGASNSLAGRKHVACIDCSEEALSWILRRPVSGLDVQRLENIGFIEPCLQCASKSLAGCKQLAPESCSETETETETETEPPLTPPLGGHDPPTRNRSPERKRSQMYRRLIRQGCDPGVARDRALDAYPEEVEGWTRHDPPDRRCRQQTPGREEPADVRGASEG